MDDKTTMVEAARWLKTQTYTWVELNSVRLDDEEEATISWYFLFQLFVFLQVWDLVQELKSLRFKLCAMHVPTIHAKWIYTASARL